jgi:hypothetical protein
MKTNLFPIIIKEAGVAPGIEKAFNSLSSGKTAPAVLRDSCKVKAHPEYPGKDRGRSRWSAWSIRWFALKR